MREGQSLMFLEAATIDSPFNRLHLSFMRTVYSTALIFMNKGRNYAYAAAMIDRIVHFGHLIDTGKVDWRLRLSPMNHQMVEKKMN